jgi:hypothetical protein
MKTVEILTVLSAVGVVGSALAVCVFLRALREGTERSVSSGCRLSLQIAALAFGVFYSAFILFI